MKKTITLVSFGYKYGEPEDNGDLTVLDVRSLPNPHSSPTLRQLDGRTSAVQNYVFSSKVSYSFAIRAIAAVREAEESVTIAFGCYGGRHRSVALVEYVAKELVNAGHTVEIRHHELKAKRTVKGKTV